MSWKKRKWKINIEEKITNEFLYDDGIEDLWKILKNNINKRYSFVEKYILKREKLDSEIDNFFNNISIDFSSRKNTLGKILWIINLPK